MESADKKRKLRVLHFGRFGEILSIFIKYGFGDLVSTLNIREIFVPRRRQSAVVKKTSRWERIRFALEELGPTFVKLGQFLSNRPDLLPAELITELEKLQDKSNPLPYSEITKTLEKCFHKPVSDIFDGFDAEPIASASLSQVHKATLKTGETVAVKVQRPGISPTISADIDILYHLLHLLENRYERIRGLHLLQLLEEFHSMIQKELNFQLEATHIERFSRDFCKDTEIYIPRVYRLFTKKTILVTEFVVGTKVSEIEQLKANNFNTSDIADRGATLILRQVFENGFFHADPHPGNILIRPDGRICFLDFGAVGILSPTLRYHLGIVLYGFVNKDALRICRTLSQLAQHQVSNPDQLEYEVTEFIEQYAQVSLHDIQLDDVLRRFTDIIINHELRVPPGFYLLLKTMITIEGVGRRLNPDFSFASYLKPYVKKMIRENPQFKFLTYDLYFTMMDVLSVMKDFPFEMKDLFRMARSGELRLQFEHKGLESMIERHDQLVNRLVFAIVLASLIIGSSVVIHSDIPPRFYEVPIIGIIGYMIAAIIGFGLIFSIIHKKKL